MRTKYYWDEETNSFVETKRGKSEGGLTIIPDEIEPTEHPADGRVYNSRSAYNAVTKAHGLEPVSKEEVRRFAERRSVNWETKDRFHEVLERTAAQLRDGRQQVYETPKHVQEMWRRIKES